MIAFIDDHRAAYGVEPICRILPIAPSTYHGHAARRGIPANPGPRAAGRRVAPGDPPRLGGELPGVRGSPGLAAAAPRGDGCGPLHHCAPDAMGLAGAIRSRTVRTTV